jgi:hypothetical protein
MAEVSTLARKMATTPRRSHPRPKTGDLCDRVARLVSPARRENGVHGTARIARLGCGHLQTQLFEKSAAESHEVRSDDLIAQSVWIYTNL